jgi:hypothetical protein
MAKLILLALSLFLSGPVLAQAGSKVADPDARLKGLTKSGKRANNKATFRNKSHNAGLDLHAHDPSKFKTAKSNRNYTYGKPGRNRVSRGAKKPLIKLGNRTTGK